MRGCTADMDKKLAQKTGGIVQGREASDSLFLKKHAPTAANGMGAVSWNPSAITVLLVDDEASMRDVASLMLKRIGFKVITAVDGEEAVSVYREHADAIGLALIDMNMPNMDGEETLRALRALNPALPIVFSSGNAWTDAAQFKESPPDGFICKPFSMAVLLQELQRILCGV